MARYRIEDVVVDTARAVACWTISTRKAGYGNVTECLYRTRRGRWWVEHNHSWTEDGRTLDYAEFVSPAEAVRLLDVAGEDVTALAKQYPELIEHADKVCE